MLATTVQYRCYRSLVKYLKKLYINNYTGILYKIIYFMSIHMVSENISLLCKYYWITCNIHKIKNYSGVSVEFRQIKAAMGVPKQQMLPSFLSDNSTAITGDFKHRIVCDFPAGSASEFSSESPKKKSRVLYSIWLFRGHDRLRSLQFFRYIFIY